MLAGYKKFSTARERGLKRSGWNLRCTLVFGRKGHYPAFRSFLTNKVDRGGLFGVT